MENEKLIKKIFCLNLDFKWNLGLHTVRKKTPPTLLGRRFLVKRVRHNLSRTQFIFKFSKGIIRYQLNKFNNSNNFFVS